MGDGRELFGRVITELGANQVVKRRRILDAGVVGRKVPQVAQRAQDGGRVVRDGLAARVDTLLLDNGASPRRDEPGGHAAAETVKLKGVVLASGGGLGVRLVVRADGLGRLDVVVEAARLVKGDDPEGLVPLGAGAQGLVDVLDELLPIGNAAGGVHGVGAIAAAGRVDVGQLGQVALLGVLVEVVHEDDAVGVVAVIGPLEPAGVLDGGVDKVVLPLHAELGDLLENGHLLHSVVLEVVLALPSRGARAQGDTVGVGGLCGVSDSLWAVEASLVTSTYTGNVRVPVVEDDKVLSQGGDDGDLVLGVVVDDLGLENLLLLLLAVQADLLSEEAGHVGLQRTGLDGSVVRNKGAVKLQVVSGDGVVRVIDNRVNVQGLGASVAAVGLADVEWVAVGAGLDRVLEALKRLTAE